jgi:hypothetical protein
MSLGGGGARGKRRGRRRREKKKRRRERKPKIPLLSSNRQLPAFLVVTSISSLPCREQGGDQKQISLLIIRRSWDSSSFCAGPAPWVHEVCRCPWLCACFSVSCQF